MRTITASQLREMVPMRTAVELMKSAFAAYTRGETISPLRTPIQLPDGSGISLFMPAYMPPTEAAEAASGAKVVSVYPGNQERGLPTINALVLVLDPTTGVPRGLIEGAAMTSLRTGAVSGAATDLMAREDASVLTVFGAGAQGLTQTAAVAAVRQLSKILIVDVDADAARSFAERLRVWDEQAAQLVEVAESAEAATREADIVCTATTSTTPVFEDSWLTPGTHVNAVGSFTPEMQEIPVATILRARVVVDAVEAVLHETGDFLIPIERGELDRSALSVELGHLVDGVHPGRELVEEITFFKSVGNAIQDMIVSGYAVSRAEELGVGDEVSLQPD